MYIYVIFLYMCEMISENHKTTISLIHAKPIPMGCILFNHYTRVINGDKLCERIFRMKCVIWVEYHGLLNTAQVALMSSHIAIQELYNSETQKLLCQNILQ